MSPPTTETVVKIEENLKEPKKPCKKAELKEPKEKELEADKPIYRTFEDFDIEELLLYGGIDCIVTSSILEKLKKRVNDSPEYTVVFNDASGRRFKKKEIIPSIAETYMRQTAEAHEFILDLELNGIKYDVEGNYRIRGQLEKEIAELEKVVYSHVGSVDMDSGQQLGHFLYEVKGFKTDRKTKTGELSVDGDTIKELAENYPDDAGWLNALAKRNDLTSIYRTFIVNYVKDFVKPDGRIHASYSMHGTGSFRIAGDSPNLTQLPRPKHGYNLRKLFTAEKGNVFVCLDFSSAEVKILGAICKDPELLRAIREGMDFHSLSASKMYGVEYETFIAVLADKRHSNHRDYKEKRQFSKALTFGILYGSSPNGIALNLGISKLQAEELIRLYFDAFPLIKVYVDNTHEMARDNKYVLNQFGQRKMEYGLIDVFKGTAVYNACLRNSQNYRVQSTSSGFGMACFAKLNKAIKPLGAKSVCTVYDSIELEVPLSAAAEVLELSFHYMNDDPMVMYDWLDFPVGVDAEIGLNWGDAEHVARGTTQEEIDEMYARWIEKAQSNQA